MKKTKMKKTYKDMERNEGKKERNRRQERMTTGNVTTKEKKIKMHETGTGGNKKRGIGRQQRDKRKEKTVSRKGDDMKEDKVKQGIYKSGYKKHVEEVDKNRRRPRCATEWKTRCKKGGLK